MKKFVSMIALCLVAVLLVSSLAGCRKSQEKLLVGRWVDDTSECFFLFAADGSGYYDLDGSGELSWKLDGSTLILQLPDGIFELTIKKLTEKELILELPHGDVFEFAKD